MMVQGLWSYVAAIGSNPDLQCGFVPFPVLNDPKMNKFYADVDSCFGISAQASPDKQKAAKKFLAWLASPQAIKIWTTDYKLTLSFKGADLSALKPPFVELMTTVGKEGAYPWAFSMYPTAVFEDACKNCAQAYVFKKKTAEAVIADIDRMWKEARKRQSGASPKPCPGGRLAALGSRRPSASFGGSSAWLWPRSPSWPSSPCRTCWAWAARRA